MRYKRISATEVIDKVTQPLDEAKKPVFRLRNRSIEGKLDLKNHTIEVAVDIQKCEFLGEVDLRYCEFEQTVNFAGCTFCEQFNSGDDLEGHTVYHKDLISTDVIFQGGVSFRGSRVESAAYFSRSEFLPPKANRAPIDFRMTYFEKLLRCDEATFSGSVLLTGLKCNGLGFLPKAKFEGDGVVNFSLASFGRTLNCDETTFSGKVLFSGLKCGDHGWFRNAAFNGQEEIDFRYASFGGNLEFEGTTFVGPALFPSLECRNLRCSNTKFEGWTTFESARCRGDGYFLDATFLGKEATVFVAASFGGSLQCGRAVFEGPAHFWRTRCSDHGWFHETAFLSEGEVDFRYASFGGNLEFEGTTFVGPALFPSLECRNLRCHRVTFNRGVVFHAIRCSESGIFESAQFLSVFKPEKINFRFARFGGDLVLEDAYFAGPVDIATVSISRALVLSSAYCNQEVSLRGATMGTLVIEGEPWPFKRASLDVRECNFDRFLGEEHVARRLSWTQDPTCFSKDPYLRLERFYRGVGNEVEAKRVHFQGGSDLRENAKDKQHGVVRWPRRTRWGDWWIKWLTGYGVRTYYLLVPILFFLLVGTGVFWSSDVLIRVDAGTSAHAEEEQGMGTVMQHLLDRASYSLDLFLPLVNLHIAEDWTPKGAWRTLYALVHQMVGWILVPLLLASLSGIIRRE
jgi:hypothetical protein